MGFDDITQGFMNFNRYRLSNLPHIKKYDRIRKIHGAVLDSMWQYAMDSKHAINDYLGVVINDIKKDFRSSLFKSTFYDIEDQTILEELIIYKNHPLLPSVVEIYLKNKRFRNADKIKMLEALNNSYVSLFKIVDFDFDNGTVIYEDCFIGEELTIVDVSLSFSLYVNKSIDLYVYNRVITCDGISYGTGIHCMMRENEELLDFIKKYKSKDISDFSKCLLVYDIFRRNSDIPVYHVNG